MRNQYLKRMRHRGKTYFGGRLRKSKRFTRRNPARRGGKRARMR